MCTHGHPLVHCVDQFMQEASARWPWARKQLTKLLNLGSLRQSLAADPDSDSQTESGASTSSGSAAASTAAEPDTSDVSR